MPPGDRTPGERHRARLQMGAGAVLTVGEAAALLPVADGEARAWLRDRGLVRSLLGRDVVRWIDVLDALRAGDAPATEGPVPARRRATKPADTLPRVRLSRP